jgi:hypothetical protein
LASEGSGTKVTWTIDYEIETLFKPMKPLMTWQMNKSFSEGLGKLKQLSEKYKQKTPQLAEAFSFDLKIYFVLFDD